MYGITHDRKYFFEISIHRPLPLIFKINKFQFDSTWWPCGFRKDFRARKVIIGSRLRFNAGGASFRGKLIENVIIQKLNNSSTTVNLAGPIHHGIGNGTRPR